MAATAVRYLRSVGASTAADQHVETLPPRPHLRAVGENERSGMGVPPAEGWGSLPVDPGEFRAVLGHFASGVTVVTAPGADDRDAPVGFACQSFASLSLDPPLVTFMVARTSTTWPHIARAGVFCVNVLGEDQGPLCRGFAVSGADKFAGVSYDAAPVTGSPRLASVPAWIDCRIQAVHTGGDHLIVVGKVEALGGVEDEDAAPLLFHRGKFGRFTH